MGIVLKFLSGPLGMYAMIAVGVLLLGSMGTAAYEHQRAERYQAEVKSKIRDLDIALEAIDSKDEAIASQMEALSKWKGIAEKSTEAEKIAVEQSKLDEAAALLASTKLRELEKKDYALPDCEAYMAIDVARVCPGHAAGLRQRQADSD